MQSKCGDRRKISRKLMTAYAIEKERLVCEVWVAYGNKVWNEIRFVFASSHLRFNSNLLLLRFKFCVVFVVRLHTLWEIILRFTWKSTSDLSAICEHCERKNLIFFPRRLLPKTYANCWQHPIMQRSRQEVASFVCGFDSGRHFSIEFRFHLPMLVDLGVCLPRAAISVNLRTEQLLIRPKLHSTEPSSSDSSSYRIRFAENRDQLSSQWQTKFSRKMDEQIDD